jgi:hypothetical protein
VATRSKSGLLLPVLLVVGLVVVFGGSKVKDVVSGLFGGSDPVIVGSGDTAFMVAAGAETQAKSCTATQMLSDRRCGDFKVVQIDAAKMPFIGRNIQLAWGEGKPFILHKDAIGTDEPKRNAVCGKFKAQFNKGSCDEYAVASSQEGGKTENVRIDEVPLREQNCQGGTLRQEYRRAQIVEGDAFMVVITNPDKIADKSYWGVDVAKEQSCGI